MSPTYTMSAHLCKQIAASWKEMRHPLESGQTSPTGNLHFNSGSYFQRASSPIGSDNGKSSMDSDRDHTSPLLPREFLRNMATQHYNQYNTLLPAGFHDELMPKRIAPQQYQHQSKKTPIGTLRQPWKLPTPHRHHEITQE
ncbi:hypothetical protein VMCG_09705 [Cytospora schulzeri]|uniref:Uncharacterized protein n=1 Tax=Cytospora schulzeri TaxID=448051 RepID=A0A423VK32_9PEZI|nr:hypothetical protein VMCG_09705 [Valsa malicola]